MKVKINKNLIDKLHEIKQNYQSNKEVDRNEYSIIIDPFKIIQFTDVISNSDFVNELKESAAAVPLFDKSNDLYSLKQSQSLFQSDDESIKEFIKFLKKIKPLLEDVYGYQFNEKISITTSLYKDGDYLLCHDDKCEDRCVAFVYYLTSLSEESGGKLDLFQHNEFGQPNKIVKSIAPVTNNFICFEVGNFTYHQVSEVKSISEERLSINGWFHCEKAMSIIPLNYKDPLPPLYNQILLEGLILLDEFININHYTPSHIDQVRETFSNESTILLTNFFNKTFYNIVESSLNNNHIKWTIKGPPNRRRYEVADLKTVRGGGNTIINLLKSSLFISYLKSITALDIEPLGDNNNASKLILELQRWSSGCYTMATDNDQFFKHDGLDVYIFFKVNELKNDFNNGGCITYLDSSDDQSSSGGDDELLTIEPIDNCFCAVYRTSDTVRFTKYLNNKFNGAYYCLTATYYEYDHTF